ncbi:hypothetical protein BGZ65_004020 [Modicella reniformis]|uniref:BZIP domain-containing protein n=1 Tax=Modicella reniformis TaxID=1440133 RepID=A0A9P6MHN0_9FUNG|nr:hypothetical protein BGZ65_004020 [Modicella reniformis]
MSLEAEFRRDVNPTPTRFLLECGAFTPGFGLNLESYPFDTSLKFLHSGTPRAELNPFDSSFRTPSSSTISVKTSGLSSMQCPSQSLLPHEEKQQRGAAVRHQPWTDMMFDEVAMPMPPMSPGLSPSSSSASMSPSPLIHSPPVHTVPLNSIDPSMAMNHTTTTNNNTHINTDTSMTHDYTFDHHNIFVFEQRMYHRQVDHHGLAPVRETLAPSEILTRPLRSSVDGGYPLYDEEEDDDDESIAGQHDHNVEEHDSIHDDQEPIGGNDDCVMDIAMSALAMRRPSTMSDVESAIPQVEYPPSINKHTTTTTVTSSSSSSSSRSSARTSKAKKDVGATATATAATTGGRKAKGATSRTGSRKRSSTEEETAEVKRQRFLERNRMAASKCREKKRLQTLKTIADADEITARNQFLHETLDQLQEEVRQLKNQILCHRDCGCDVIQRFVRTSLCGSPTSATSTSSASCSPVSSSSSSSSSSLLSASSSPSMSFTVSASMPTRMPLY